MKERIGTGVLVKSHTGKNVSVENVVSGEQKDGVHEETF